MRTGMTSKTSKLLLEGDRRSMAEKVSKSTPKVAHDQAGLSKVRCAFSDPCRRGCPIQTD